MGIGLTGVRAAVLLLHWTDSALNMVETTGSFMARCAGYTIHFCARASPSISLVIFGQCCYVPCNDAISQERPRARHNPSKTPPLTIALASPFLEIDMMISHLREYCNVHMLFRLSFDSGSSDKRSSRQCISPYVKCLCSQTRYGRCMASYHPYFDRRGST
ncbi:hypothetical protein BXZ70DRAFT_499053 [Cristinia sonorae]|uniref:Secreted protein n=1 Tax=Cristinia sonorae TaxID=1940300 RepID=A0A8K0XLC7_9AGAR|nr:hypothetical protein BXZ70DRAFT_499053 [Cristinia sonorae]